MPSFFMRLYHGYFAYNFGESDATVRPYFLGGLGATHYGSLDTPAGSIGGEPGSGGGAVAGRHCLLPAWRGGLLVARNDVEWYER
jgi:hypothetical protein